MLIGVWGRKTEKSLVVTQSLFFSLLTSFLAYFFEDHHGCITLTDMTDEWHGGARAHPHTHTYIHIYMAVQTRQIDNMLLFIFCVKISLFYYLFEGR